MSSISSLIRLEYVLRSADIGEERDEIGIECINGVCTIKTTLQSHATLTSI